ncbi:hypothetical protein Q8A67_015682 [Cirrhinus molitorella]|uniref:Uncharacterized protein n=1 Tax=Cirrhinus molitorella TaxID=172907 RepID=A0AA88PF74_9TELE|nr:hypothetical protein Q8A67_015682 [Cirrhinus molitorella]
MATICKICAGPIEPPDQHDACLGLVHAEAALDDSSCGHCADLPARVLRARRDVARGLFWGEALPMARASPCHLAGLSGHPEEEVDLMSILASEREDWAGSEADQLDSAGTPDLQEELMRVLSKAVQELELTWSPPEEPARSKLDSWYFRSTRKADSRASVPFFPDVHEQLRSTRYH